MTNNQTNQTGQNNKVSSVLAQKAMVATLATSNWSGRIKDQLATEELLNLKSADKNAGSFTKALVDKKYLKDIRTAISGMRAYHNEQTLAWDNNGGRLLPSVKYNQYTMKLREFQRDLTAAVTAFEGNFQNIINESSAALGDLFVASEYPDITEIVGKFQLDVGFDKVSEAADFRVDIPELEKKKIQQKIETKVEAKHAEAMEKIWKRIFLTVEHMAERLSDEDAIFRDSLVENIETLVSVLPGLNILEDQKLADMTTELEDNLCGYTPEELREDKKLRKDVAKKSKDIMDQMTDLYSQPEKEEKAA